MKKHKPLRQCSVCHKPLSRYNKSNECFHHLVEPEVKRQSHLEAMSIGTRLLTRAIKMDLVQYQGVQFKGNE